MVLMFDFTLVFKYTFTMGKVKITMKFVTDIDKKKYEKFVKNHPTKSHFLQSYAWGEFSRVAKKMTPHYVGLVNDKDQLVATALLLQKKLPLGYSYFYSPRGFVLDFYDEEVLKGFVENIKKYAKKNRAIFVKIDPDIIWKEYDYQDKEVELKKDPKIVFDNLKKLGFKHQGFTKNFETMQPRYTFRIDLSQSMEEIEQKFSKTVKQRINKGTSLGTEVSIGNYDDITTFSHLMDLTEDRKDFLSHDLEYYQNLYKIYNKDNKMNLFLGKINTKKVIEQYSSEKEEIIQKIDDLKKRENLSTANQKKLKELEMRSDKLQEYIDEYQDACQKYGEEITLNAHVIMEYGDKAWTLYAGNHNVLVSSQSNYKVYYEHIKYCHEQGLKYYDHFGTIGDLRKENPRYGLHIFKKAFGGDYIEFIGEFDLVTNHLMYFLFTKLVPLYRNLVRKKSKAKLKRSIDDEDRKTN